MGSEASVTSLNHLVNENYPKAFRYNLLFIIVMGICIWQSSLWIYDSMQHERTSVLQQQLQSGNSTFRWDFNNPETLDGAYADDEFSWQNGQLSGDVKWSGFWLNLKGRYVDATQIQQIKLRLFSTTDSSLSFFHQQPNNDALHHSQPIKTHKGWQEITINLADLIWTSRDGFETRYPAVPSSWGGPDQVVSLFGVTPIQTGLFKVDWIELVSNFAAQAAPPSPIYVNDLDHPIFDQVFNRRDKLWVLGYESLWRTAESDYALRTKIRDKNPNALVLTQTKDGVLDGVASKLKSYMVTEVPMLLSVILAIALYWILVFPSQNIAFAQLTVLVLSMVLLSWYMMQLQGTLLAAALLPLLVLLFQWRPQNFNYSFFYNRSGWVSITIITLLPAAFLLSINTLDPSSLPELASRLALYVIWALFQQFIFLGYILPRLNALVPSYAIVLTASIFAYMHFPNFALMSGTFIMGLIWFSWYSKHQNWWAVSISHALMAVAFRDIAPDYWRVTGEVGLQFLAKLNL